MKNPTKFRALKNRYSGDVPLREDYEILSSNRVTGWSVNFPIVATCKPSKVCAMTCYGLSGPITWSASLDKHTRNHGWCKSNPEAFSAQLVKECEKRLQKDKKFYVRWNGVGDLFSESVDALILLNKALPELPIWCVTRIPEYVPPLANLKNLYVHFSLDKSSMKRQETVKKLFKKLPDNLFFSYQGDKNEIVNDLPDDISVLFFDRYKIPAGSEKFRSFKPTCPLNLNEDINNMCYQCRRCFNGEAVAPRTCE
jgi:hypothetical protein